MTTEFRPAPEVEEIARDLIEQHHSHLVEARIIYAFRYGPWESRGKTRLGMAYKCSAWDKYALRDPEDPDDPGPDFRILINGDEWDRLTLEQRTALVDHELCHCARGEDDDQGNPRWMIAGHDVEEFSAIIDRHGLWMRDVEQFGKVAARKVNQLHFPLDEAAAARDDDTRVTLQFRDRKVETTVEGLRRAAERLEREGPPPA